MKKIITYVTSIIIASLLFFSCKKDEVKSISLNTTSLKMSVGETFQLEASLHTSGNVNNYPVSYTSSNEDIATVSPTGLIAAKGVGEATIEVAAGGKTNYCQIEIVKSELNFKKATSNYWGDLFRNGTHVFDFYALEDGLEIASNGDILGTGSFIYLDLNTYDDMSEISGGIYVGSKDGSANTFINGYMGKDLDNKDIVKGSYVGIVDNSTIQDMVLIIGGELTFNVQDNYYVVSGYILTEHNQKYEINYKGEIPVQDNVTPIPQNLTQGSLTYYGDVDGYGKAALFGVRLGDDATNMTDFTDGYDMMSLEVGVPINSSAFDIPAGTYTVQNTQVVEPNYMLGGFVDAKDNFYGSWYYTGDQFQITEGNVTFKKEGTVYTIDYDLKDKYFGYRLSGTWKGELTYNNEANNVALNPSRVIRAKAKSRVEKSLVIGEKTRINVKSRKRALR